MATTLGTVATAIAGFSVEDEGKPSKGHAISQRTVELISLLLLPISILMIAYALFVFYSRSENIRKKQVPGDRGILVAGWGKERRARQLTTARLSSPAFLAPSTRP